MTGSPHTHRGPDAIQSLGSGLGYRREMRDGILAAGGAIDVLEVVTEQFSDDAADMRELEGLCDRFRVIPHGIGLSVGSGTLDSTYLKAVKRISDVTGSPFYSEHLAMTRAPGIDIGHLSPLWFTEPILRVATENVNRVQDLLRKPLVLENVTYPFDIPNQTMSQAEFFHRLVAATDCGILLDVTNLSINAANHRFDPVAFLRGLPLDHVVQVHLSGGFVHDGVVVDSHSKPVAESTWRLLEMLAGLTPIKGSIIEHDADFPDDMAVLLEQIDRARRVIAAGRIGSAQTAQ